MTDSIPLSESAASCPKIKQVSIARLLGEAIKRIHSSDSVSFSFRSGRAGSDESPPGTEASAAKGGSAGARAPESNPRGSADAPGGRETKDRTMTQQMPVLSVEARSAAGKGEARRLRRTGLRARDRVWQGPPVHGDLRHAEGSGDDPQELAAGRTIGLVEIEVGGIKLLAMVRDFALHPVKRELEHVDFIEVKLDQPVDVFVPLFAIGKPVGVVKGGVLRIVHRTIPVRCLPDRIPVKVEADVTHLELGQHIATRELKLPEGVVARLPPEQTLIAVVAPEKEVEEVAPGAPGAAVVRGRLGRLARQRVARRPRAGAAAGGDSRCSREGRQEEEVARAAGRRPRQPRTRAREQPRHNVGFMVADTLRRREGWPEYKAKFSGLWTRGALEGADVALLKPQTYMNLSGDSVQPASAFLKVPPESILVVHDELDLAWKDVRLKLGGGHAGHNGIRSIIQRLGTPGLPPRPGRHRQGAARVSGRRGRLGALELRRRGESGAPRCGRPGNDRRAAARWPGDGPAAAMNAVNAWSSGGSSK